MMVGVGGTVGKPSADGATRDYSAVAHNRIAYNRVYHSQYGFILGGEDWLVENNEVNRLLWLLDEDGDGDGDGWRREVNGGWSAPLAAEPKQLPGDDRPWSEFSYDQAAKRIMVKSSGDPRLHVFETVLREQGINLAGKRDVADSSSPCEEITVVNTLKAGAANP